MVVDESDISNFFAQQQQGGEKKVDNAGQKQVSVNIDDAMVEKVLNKLVEKVLPQLNYALSVMIHTMNYNHIRDKIQDLNPEDYIKLNDEIEKELGELKADKVEYILSRWYDKRQKMIERLSKNKESGEEGKNKEVVKKVAEVDVKTNDTPLLTGSEVKQTKEDEEAPNVKVFKKLMALRQAPSMLNKLGVK